LTKVTEFVSGDITQSIEWSVGNSSGVAFHRIERQYKFVFGEASEIAAWGTWFLSTAADDNVRTQTDMAQQSDQTLICHSLVDPQERSGYNCETTIHR
jgi:hypothetical protein